MDKGLGQTIYMVIGDAGLGAAIASRLLILKKNLVLVGRKGPTLTKSRFEGWGKVTYFDIKPLANSDVSGVHLVFVTVKAFDLGGALERYLPYLPKGVPIIPLAGGAIEDTLWRVARKYPDFLWRLGYCSFDVLSVSDNIYSLRGNSGKAIWGPLERRSSRERISGPPEPAPAEKELFDSDRGVFFQWQDAVVPSVRRKWLFNLVVNSLSASLALERTGELLNDMKRLTQVFEEAYRLGNELWGAWDRSYDKLLEELVCYISATADLENTMARDVRLGKRTENEYFAKLALGRRGYDQLSELATDIDKKTKFTDRRIRPKTSTPG